MANLYGNGWNSFQRIIRNLKALTVMLCVAVIHQPGEAASQTIPGTYNASLSWDAHPDPTVIGYRIHYGTASGTYTGSVTVGKVTSMIIPGLASGVKYYFSMTAHIEGSDDSGYSNEVSYLPGIQTTAIHFAANGDMTLSVKGLIGEEYDVEASENLKDWSVIDTVIMEDGGAMVVPDPDQDLYPKRFYRTSWEP